MVTADKIRHRQVYLNQSLRFSSMILPMTFDTFPFPTSESGVPSPATTYASARPYLPFPVVCRVLFPDHTQYSLGPREATIDQVNISAPDRSFNVIAATDPTTSRMCEWGATPR